MERLRDVIEAAVNEPVADQLKAVAGALEALVNNPTTVRNYGAASHFQEKINHSAVRYSLYRSMAAHFGYFGTHARLPLPWATEITIKALFPGSSMDEWVRFRADKLGSAASAVEEMAGGRNKRAKHSK